MGSRRLQNGPRGEPRSHATAPFDPVRHPLLDEEDQVHLPPATWASYVGYMNSCPSPRCRFMTGPTQDRVEKLRAFVEDLPDALVAGFRTGRDLSSSVAPGTRQVYAVGMGGSAVAADLLQGLVEAETSLSLEVVRGPVLPRTVNADSTILVVSFSGNTAEALRAYGGAGRRGAHRVAVTSGGALAVRATADGVPVLKVPGGRPPRSAVGYLVGGLMGVLDPFFPRSNERRLVAAAERLRARIRTLGAPHGPAATLARGIDDRLPFFVAESSLGGLARRWKNQVEENAKRLATVDEVPELFHNSLVGWDAIDPAQAARYAVVLIEWAGEDDAVKRGFRYLEHLLRSRRVRTLVAPLPPRGRLEAMLFGLAWGDLMSLELARRHRVDPYATAAIDRAKARLAGTNVRAAAGIDSARRTVP